MTSNKRKDDWDDDEEPVVRHKISREQQDRDRDLGRRLYRIIYSAPLLLVAALFFYFFVIRGG